MAAKKAIIMRSASTNVFVNQALEAALAESVSDGEVALYLWRNDNAVVIGRNQDAFAECRVDALEASGGLLARRLTGGGAVWHDAGNLNFTFVSKQGLYDKERDFAIVLGALAECGVRAELGGRNDVLVDGAKVGGSAYLRRGDIKLHHGTLLVTTSPETVARYLTPAPAKFEGKAVKSVRSRVAPLSATVEGLTPENVADAVERGFLSAFADAEAVRTEPFSLGAGKVMSWTGFFGSDEWRYGERAEHDSCFDVTVFGERATLKATHADGGVRADLYSDSLDGDLIAALRALLQGKDVSAFGLSEQDRKRAEEEAARLLAVCERE